jgi:hypothetical protein
MNSLFAWFDNLDSTGISSLVTGTSSAAALLAMALTRRWRTHIFLTVFVAADAATLVFLPQPQLATSLVRTNYKLGMGLCAVLIALETGRRAFGAGPKWESACKTTLAVMVLAATLGLTVMGLPLSENLQWGYRGTYAVDLAVIVVVMRTRYEMWLANKRTTALSDIATNAIAFVFASQLVSRALWEISIMDALFFRWMPVFIYTWAMLRVSWACMHFSDSVPLRSAAG